MPSPSAFLTPQNCRAVRVSGTRWHWGSSFPLRVAGPGSAGPTQGRVSSCCPCKHSRCGPTWGFQGSRNLCLRTTDPLPHPPRRYQLAPWAPWASDMLHRLPLPSRGTKAIAFCRGCPRTPYVTSVALPSHTYPGPWGSTPSLATARCLPAAAALLPSLLWLMTQHPPGTRLPTKDTHPLYLTEVPLHL